MKGTSDVLNKGTDWVEQHIGYSPSMRLAHQAKRKLEYISKRQVEKPTIGLFGASQVGKSYMVNNLICDESGRLLLKNNGGENESENFLRDINPEGHGNEATIAVTRFSHEKKLDENCLPVELRIFSPKDLVCLLCDSYYSDLDGSLFVKDATGLSTTIQETFSNLKGSGIDEHDASVLSKSDVLEVYEYLEKRFSGVQWLQQLKSNGYWEQLVNSAESISHHALGDVCSVLWGGLKEITDLFKRLLNEMEKLEFNEMVHVGYEAVKRGDNSLISTATLSSLFDESAGSITVQLTNGNEAKCRADLLCALVAEIHFFVSDASAENRKFIQEVDIIDFPGARSRPEIMKINHENLIQMVIRGKVSYLYNSYNEQYKISILCACIRTQQTNVTSVPRLINEWVEHNVGTTAHQRGLSQRGVRASLFIIFTWWNTQLEFSMETDTADPTERIEKLFNTRYREEIIGDSNWHAEWTDSQSFRNFYLLRDFLKSDKIFTKASTEGKQEEGMTNEGQENYLKRYREEFLNYHSSKKFFDKAETSFDMASTPNKDGSEYIIGNLVELAETDFNQHRLDTLLNHFEEQFLHELKKHFHSNDSDKQLLDAYRKSSLLEDQLAQQFFRSSNGNMYYFGSFKELFNIKEDDLRDNFREILRDENIVEVTGLRDSNVLEMKYAECLELPTQEERLEYLQKKYKFGSKDELITWLKEHNLLLYKLIFEGRKEMQKRSDKLAKEAYTIWKSDRLDIKQFKAFVEKGISEELLVYLVENLLLGFEKLGIEKIISEQVSKYVDSYKSLDHAHDLVPHLAAGIINDYIDCAGWNYVPEEDKHKVAEAKQALSDLAFEIPNENDTERPISKEEISARLEEIDKLGELIKDDRGAIGKMPVVKNFYKWTNYLKLAAIANCDIPTYDIEANEQLGLILNELNEQKGAQLTQA